CLLVPDDRVVPLLRVEVRIAKLDDRIHVLRVRGDRLLQFLDARLIERGGLPSAGAACTCSLTGRHRCLRGGGRSATLLRADHPAQNRPERHPGHDVSDCFGFHADETILCHPAVARSATQSGYGEAGATSTARYSRTLRSRPANSAWLTSA